MEVVAEVVQGSDVAEAPAPGAEGTLADAGPSPATRRAHLRLAVEQVEQSPVAATISLLVLDGVPELAPGDRVRFRSRLYLPRGFANPGLPDGRLLARAQGVDLLATVRVPSDLEQLSKRPRIMAYPRRCAFRLRQAMSRAINERLAEPSAGFVRTMVVGERSDVPAVVEEGFRAAGATHVLSVSGLHLAVVVFLCFQALRWLAARCPAWALRVPPKLLASALALPATAFYTLLTGEAVATVRSAIMASVVLGAAVVNRPLSLAASIGAAALLLLIHSPAAILDVSFQLSFASVVGLGLFSRWLVPAGTPAPAKGWRRASGWLLRSLSASIAACLITLPIVAWSPWSSSWFCPAAFWADCSRCYIRGSGRCHCGWQASPRDSRSSWPMAFVRSLRSCWFAFRTLGKPGCWCRPPLACCGDSQSLRTTVGGGWRRSRLRQGLPGRAWACASFSAARKPSCA